MRLGLAMALAAASASGAPFDPADATGLLAWFDAREGKTGDPVTAWARKAGTGLQDLSNANGPDDGTDHLSFVAADASNALAGGTVANWTTLHRDGCVIIGVVRVDSVTGNKTIFDNIAQNPSSSRTGIAIFQNGANLFARVSNGSGAYLLQTNVGPSYGPTAAPTTATWAIFEFGWEPTLGGYLRVNGTAPLSSEQVGSPSSSNPLYPGTIGATTTTSPLTNWMDGDIGQLFFAGPSILQNRNEIRNVVSALAAIYGITLDPGGEFTSGAAADTVLV